MRAVRLIASVSALTLASAANAQSSYPSPYGSSPYASVPSPYSVQPLSDADLLASQIRLLAANPQDLQALIRAGELALRLDDDTAAAAFFARAERIDPRNARVKAGEGSLLVSAERPGDALRHFAEAERLGADPRSFAADRGLAYDLIGEQERAQRDYRVALRAGANDETQRRYALSLGISGKRELALTQIDQLLRKSDRGAWRARAFILAMAGDKAGAEKIATSMMPSGMAQGLQPFFEILSSLRPADRAFAVHFGEVRPSLDRVNDARLVPPLAALGPDPTAPVQVAAVVKAPVVVDAREERRRAKEARRNRGRVEVVASVAPPPPPPLPAPPSYGAIAPRTALAANTPMTGAPTATFVQRLPGTPAVQSPYAQPQRAPATPYVQPLPASPYAQALPAPRYVQRAPVTAAQAANTAAMAQLRALPTTPSVTVPSRPVEMAAAPTQATIAAPAATVAAPLPVAVPQVSAPVVRAPAPTAFASATAAPVVLAASNTPLSGGDRGTAASTTRLGATPGGLVAAPSTSTAGAAVPSPATVPTQTATAPPGGTLAAAAESATIVAATPAPVPVAPTPVAPTPAAPTPVRSEDSILAAIISDIKVPANESPVETAPSPTPAPIERARAVVPPVDTTRADEVAAQKKLTAEKKLADKKAADQLALAEAKKAAADKKLAETKKAAADKKIADAKKAVADKKLADAKKAAEEKRKNDPKLLEPSRIWVQVAGGANENDLPKQWSKLRSGNKQLAGRSGWTTPLRATNRILTGPFKTDDEAQAFVNKIAKDGVSGFVFVSDAGQKISKLGAK
ncbi:SPOR domain-containing protein [Sphingomonas sp. 10B4]|uniref:SPOR domain-containing protein n=1 Tax=Sphingomonas sp. 10B4 TaxID=3048575 RepID=UPI002AB594EE|nr:SPOR domain-containing protein [Sphingomonas sp. 10B4]MDY7523244.1 SPOR domain-containing protein [Sphingomonas sp. 10B4]MEB0282714.1 SPOR domain-containing protein [Sphingomonas sp. 10B4]